MLSFLKRRETQQVPGSGTPLRTRQSAPVQISKPQFRISGMKNPEPLIAPQATPQVPQNVNTPTEFHSTKEICDAIQNVNDQTLNLQNESASIRDQLAKKREENEKCKQSIASASSSIETKKSEVDQIVALQQKLRKSIDQCQTKIESCTTKCEELSKSAQEINNQVKENQEKYTKTEEEVNTSQASYNEKDSEVTLLIQNLKTAENDLNDLESTNSNLKKQKDDATSQLKQFEIEFSSIENNENNILAKQNECKNAKTKNENQLKQIEEEINTLQLETKQLTEEERTINSSLITQKAKLSVLPKSEYNSSTNRNEIEYTNTQINKFKREVEAKQNSIKILIQQKNNILQKAPSSSPTASRFQSEFKKMQDLQKNNSELMQTQINLQMRLEKAHSEFASAVEELRKQMSLTIDAKTAAVQKQNETQQKLATDNNESMKLNEEISDLTRKLQEYQRTKLENNQNIEKIKSEINAAKQERAQEAAQQQKISSHQGQASQNSQRFKRMNTTKPKSRILSLD